MPNILRALRVAALFVATVALTSCETERPQSLDAEFLASGTKLYSQFKEELIIRHFFNDKRDGFSLDVGAFMWDADNTTLYLEKHLGWRGIAIDAQEEYAQGWRDNRPGSKFFRYAVTAKSGETIKFYQAGGISSPEIDNIKKWQESIPFEPKEITVPTVALDDLLTREGVAHVDFVSMDINESEPPALAGFDIKRWSPALVLIEANTSTRDAIAAYMAKNAYERIAEYDKHDSRNWYFRPAVR